MTYVAVAAATLVSLILIRVLFNKWQNCATKPRVVRHSGCEDPPRYNHKDAHGQDLFELSMKAFREQRFLTFTEELFEKYGTTFSTISHGKIWIRSKDPEVSKAIYSTFFEKFGLEPIRYEPEGFFGDGILVVDGAKWKHSRGLIRPAFEVAHVANFDRLYRHVGRFLDILPKDGSTVDLLPILKRLTLDLSTEFIFGKPMNALSSSKECEDFIHAFTAAQRGVVTPAAAREDDWERCCDHVTNYIDERVTEALLRVSNEDENDSEKKRYVRVVDEMAKATKDKVALRFQVLSVFSPAHDTVAVTVGNLFFYLARHQSVWSKLRAELLPTASQPLTYQILNSYKYLNWTIRETLRLLPLAQASSRECLDTCILPVGGGVDGKSPLFVEKGTVIETNFRLAQRDKDYWGTDADEFRPERWETMRPTWQFIPFSGGPRICPAQKLVYIEAQYITASIVRKFSRLENRDPEPRWIEEHRLIFQSRNGAVVGLIK